MSMWSNYSNAWKNSETAGQFRIPPDGEYDFTIDDVIGTETKNRVPCIEWRLTTVIPSGEQMQVRKTSFIGDKSFPMLKRDIKALGVDPDLIDMIYMDAWLEYFKGIVVRGEVTTSEKDGKIYRNINFLELINGANKPQPNQTGFVQVDDDGLPWD